MVLQETLTIDMDNGVGADGTVQFINTVGANDDLDVIDITGNLNLDAAITNTTSLSVSGTSNLGASVTTTSTQTYSGNATISNDIILTTTNSNVSFGATTNAGTAGDTLTIAAGSGDVTFTDAVGGSTAMGNITITTGALSAAAIKVQGTIDITNTDTSSITGIISDGASSAIVTKAGSGTLTLSGTNTYTGATTVNNGILTISGSGKLGNGNYTGTLTVAAGKTFNYSSSSAQSFSDWGAGTGTINLNGSDIVTLSGNQDFTGTLNVSQMLIMVGVNANTEIAGLGNAATIDIQNGGTIKIQQVNHNAFLGYQSSGAPDIYIRTGGELTTDDDNGAYGNHIGGSLTLDGGTLSWEEASGDYSINSHAGTWTLDQDVVVTDDSTISAPGLVSFETDGNTTFTVSENKTLTVSGYFYNSLTHTEVAVEKAGSGTMILQAAGTHPAAFTISAGTLKVTVDGALGTTAGATIVAEGATLDFANVTYSTAEAVTVNGGTIATSTGTSIVAGTITLGAHSIFDVDGTQLTLSGNVTDGDNTYNITKTGDGILVLSNTTNSYDGTTTISTGTLTVIGRLDSGTYSANIINNSALIYNSASTQEFAGAVSGIGTLTKNGSSTLTLSNTNTYTGDTTISAGTIKLTGSVNALTDLSIASGATLDLQSTQTFATLDLDGTISNSAGSSELTITGASDLEGSITTSGTQDYEGAITLTDNTTLVSGDQITFDTTVNSEGSETNNLTVTATELQVDGIIGGTQTLGAISITGILDLNAAITNATSLSVSSTSNLGANVTTSSTQTYSDDVTISADISLNTSGGDVTFDGDVTSAVSGSSSSLIYYTTTPKRNGSGNIVYETGYGLGGSDAAASFSGDIDTVTYRMEYELGGTTYYAEATFDSWDGLTISDLKIPDSSSQALAIQRVVNNMSVSSNIDGTYNSTYGSSGVTTGSGKTGVLEIWYSNYAATTAISGIGGSGSNYDYNDTRSSSLGYGSFQVHNLTDTETVFAWNRHADNKPDVGFGNNTNSQHSDWTFQNNYNNETWALKVSVNNSVASNNLTISTGSGAVDINGAVANIGTLSITSNSTSSEASGIISTDTIITKAGSGTLLLSANNTYTGQTNINAGIISITDNNSLGTTDGATIVADGASLSISNDITSAENITISGTGISSNGAIRNTADDNTLTGLITLGANSEIQIDTGSSLTLNPTTGSAVTGAYNLTIDSVGTSTISDPIATLNW